MAFVNPVQYSSVGFCNPGQTREELFSQATDTSISTVAVELYTTYTTLTTPNPHTDTHRHTQTHTDRPASFSLFTHDSVFMLLTRDELLINLRIVVT